MNNLISKPRKIIHIDMDAFYASVEIRDNPKLRFIPLAIGGDPNGRGVIAAASYKARKYGVRSAMPSWKAKQLCPDLLILPPNFDKYRKESQIIKDVFLQFTDIIEPLSLDEAYLDVSLAEACKGSATLIAQQIRKQILQTSGLTASAGIAPNKFLAKIASDWNKPDGIFVITPEEVPEFIKTLNVKQISGIGRVTTQKLHSLNISTCEELQKLDFSTLYQHFGNRALNLYELCRGIDHRPVLAERPRKSISVESTFTQDLSTIDECLEQIPLLYEKLTIRYEKIKDLYQIKKPFVKVKFSDFTVTTVESVLYPLPSIESYQALVKIGWERKQIPVRLLGIGFSLKDDEEVQLTLF